MAARTLSQASTPATWIQGALKGVKDRGKRRTNGDSWKQDMCLGHHISHHILSL